MARKMICPLMTASYLGSELGSQSVFNAKERNAYDDPQEEIDNFDRIAVPCYRDACMFWSSRYKCCSKSVVD